MFMQNFTRLTAAFAPVALPAVARGTPVTTGLVAGTLLETRLGWRAVETLAIGDAVQTLDGGMSRIMGLHRCILRADAGASLIRIDGGWHDACSDVLLLPGQHVLLDTLNDPQQGGAPFAMIAALALLASPGARRTSPATDVQIITPMFADEEVVYANSGVLLHCPGLADGAGHYPENSFFPCLEATEARHFLHRRTARLAA